MRRASHAGSWYSAHASTLSAELDAWLAASRRAPDSSVKAIIAPHAGYRFSGETAAHAYASVDARNIKRVVVLGPSHHVHLDRCGLTRSAALQTPLGELPVDVDLARALAEAHPDLFTWLDAEDDENEHSVEMHLPFIARIFQRQQQPVPAVLPVLVGAFSMAMETKVGRVLAPLLADPATLLVVSSDFCHWGKRFGFVLREKGALHESIERLDRRGMQLIEANDHAGFAQYEAETRNTICGRHPIGVLLACTAVLSPSSSPPRLQFLHYAQSSRCVSDNDSSVSYAACVVTV
jgi:AmmeMemoRadiSam system protein B